MLSSPHFFKTLPPQTPLLNRERENMVGQRERERERKKKAKKRKGGEEIINERERERKKGVRKWRVSRKEKKK